MSKKKALTGAIVVMVIWFAMWGFGYWYLANQVNTASTRGFAETASEFLTKQESFLDQYGQPSSIKPISEAPVKNDTAATTEYYMDFRCITNKGEYSIRVYQTWGENESWVLRYEELPTG